VSDPRWTVVCAPEAAVEVVGDDFCTASASASDSPIDDYYAYVEGVLRLGNPPSLAANTTLGRLLVLGLVSGVESYLRAVISGLIKICPAARGSAADQMLHFGAIDYYGLDFVELGLFDAASLASSEELRRATKRFLGLEIRAGSSVHAALDEFNKACHLRHAAVHSRGRFNRGNAGVLGLAAVAAPAYLDVNFAALQGLGAACHSFVRSYNRFLYNSTVTRWLAAGELSGDWKSDKPAYTALFALFYSKTDQAGPRTAHSAYRSLAAAGGPLASAG
jgi:hypothetical protein